MVPRKFYTLNLLDFDIGLLVILALFKEFLMFDIYGTLMLGHLSVSKNELSHIWLLVIIALSMTPSLSQ